MDGMAATLWEDHLWGLRFLLKFQVVLLKMQGRQFLMALGQVLKNSDHC